MIDFSGLVSQLLSTYWWLLPLLIIVALFKAGLMVDHGKSKTTY